MKRCIIFGGGPLSDCDKIQLDLQAQDDTIACDAGYLTARHFGIVPRLVVGDFDSYKGAIENGAQVYTAPVRKDDTDTMLAVKLALKAGCKEFLLIGMLGGRLDHTLANLQTLGYLCEHGARGEIRANRNRCWAVQNGALRLKRLEGWHLSVFALDGCCRGVSLRGVSYPLEGATLISSFPLGVSNEFAAETAEIAVEDGTLLVIASQEGGEGSCQS
ncbi:MAG: thiamine diphosphokinase [Anaerotruncus sp.]|nr:thiamine diphosphokinase [Anaerotruncus sp.]